MTPQSRKKNKNDASINKKTPVPKIRPFSPFSLYIAIPGLLLWLIFGFGTKGLQNDTILGQVIGSIRLITLTMSLFFSVTGTIGYISYPDDREKFHNSLKKRLFRNKDVK